MLFGNLSLSPRIPTCKLSRYFSRKKRRQSHMDAQMALFDGIMGPSFQLRQVSH
eukprot:c7326_g1_i1 orf=192-353(-)